MTRLTASRDRAAFSLVEVLISSAVSVLALTGFFASAGQAMHIVKSGKEMAMASQLLQERIETFRSNSWSYVTTSSGVTTLVSGATNTATNFPGAAETYLISDYPALSGTLTVTRSSAGTTSSSGSDMASTVKCVKLTAKVTWTGLGKVTRTRQIATIIAKNGL